MADLKEIFDKGFTKAPRIDLIEGTLAKWITSEPISLD